MNNLYHCSFRGRVAALRAAAEAGPPRSLNGIDYLEVAPGQRRLDVHFVRSLDLTPARPLTAANVEIRGGVRIRDPQVTRVTWQNEVLAVEVAAPGDFSRYTLCLVTSAGNAAPPDQIDPALAEIEFSFKVDCPSDFDCREVIECPPTPERGPPIDYLGRDYTNFRRQLLDRLSVLLPGWRERSPADMLVALTEVVAFRGDELSYFQDAVATEAYLGTARRRVSVRRHARLLDYQFHDGCNARAWIAFEVTGASDGHVLDGADPATGLGGTMLLTRVRDAGTRMDADRARQALDAGAQAFELLHSLTLFAAHNAVPFYTWSDEECCIPKGATRAMLRDEGATRLRLRPGDVLIFEERRSAVNGAAADADARRRHAVRLTKVDPQPAAAERRDPVTGVRYVDIEWGDEDALPFELWLSKRIGGVLVEDMSVALGNVALADQGRTVPDNAARDAETIVVDADARPLLENTERIPLTHQGRVRGASSDGPVLVDPAASASAAFRWDMADVRPAIELRDEGDRRQWTVQRDLLASGPHADDFVIEVEHGGGACLRFGDGVNGSAMPEGERLRVRYRIGNGTSGNVGAEAISHAVTSAAGIVGVRNPLPAQGGIEPHPLAQAKLYAPQAFRRQERAVTVADYSAVVELHPDVQRAVATRRWTGSWYTIFISVDRRGGKEIDDAFEDELVRFVERYRLAGHDVEIDAPRLVPLDVAFHVCTKPGYLPDDVEVRLLESFGSHPLVSGTGFFHPDNFSFGQPVYLSAMIARAMTVPGVSYITPIRFQRWGRTPAGEIAAGHVATGPLEIARLDNDANAPEHGRIEFQVHAGA